MNSHSSSGLYLPLFFISAIAVAIIVLSKGDAYQFDGVLKQGMAPPHMRVLIPDADVDVPKDELTTRFEQAVVMLHAKEYEHAMTALNRVIELAPRMPEAYVNMGYALLGLKRYRDAHDFFMTATNINSYQANAYWGLAVALESLKDPQAALGAMRTFIHLAKKDDPFLRRARSALWEWESQLARGPLAKEEKEFLERGAQQWQQRNSPQLDAPEVDERWTIK